MQTKRKSKRRKIQTIHNPQSKLEHANTADAKDTDINTSTFSQSPRTATGRIQLHACLLSEGRKLKYKLHKSSLTGYERGDEPEMNDENKEELDVANNVLLPTAFASENIDLDRLYIQTTTGKKKTSHLLCVITKDAKLLYHPLEIQVSVSRVKVNKRKKAGGVRKTTKLDYMEYMVEKFGSRAAIFYPKDALLSLHTTYILNEPCGAAANLCEQIADKIKKSLHHKERKDFKFFDWQCSVFEHGEDVDATSTLKKIQNKDKIWRGDYFIRNLIVQIPIQIARGVNNQFMLMYNAEDDQQQYNQVGSFGSRNLCKQIRFSAYDGLIKSWEGPIKVVTSMGKQSTGKSYMLNHLFGTKFDISGGRCTDGAWLSARVIGDILYIVCDFEGLGSFEDMLLATFNAAISNCTIFKCDNRFDRSIEDMFNKFQAGVGIMKGSEGCFQGELMLIENEECKDEWHICDQKHRMLFL